jgi:diacylglycerol kinase
MFSKAKDAAAAAVAAPSLLAVLLPGLIWSLASSL